MNNTEKKEQEKTPLEDKDNDKNKEHKQKKETPEEKLKTTQNNG